MTWKIELIKISKIKECCKKFFWKTASDSERNCACRKKSEHRILRRGAVNAAVQRGRWSLQQSLIDQSSILLTDPVTGRCIKYLPQTETFQKARTSTVDTGPIKCSSLDAFDDLVRRSECCTLTDTEQHRTTQKNTEQHRTNLSSFHSHRPSPGNTKNTLFVYGGLIYFGKCTRQ